MVDPWAVASLDDMGGDSKPPANPRVFRELLGAVIEAMLSFSGCGSLVLMSFGC